MSLGGVETVLRNRCEGLESIGMTADFIFLEDRGGWSSFRNLPRSQTFVTSDLREIERILNRGKYDLVSVIDTPQVHSLMRTIARSQRVLMEVHTPHPLLREYIQTDIIEDAVAVVVPTATFGELVDSEMKKPHPPIVAIPNPLNRLFLQDVDNNPRHGRVPIAYVGRIEQIKDWKESVQIVRQTMRHRKDIELLMVGRLIDERPKDVFRMFSKLGLSGNTRWLPFIEYDRMPAFYHYIAANNGVYLTSSKGESFGMTVIESMACKLPVVACDIPVFREVLGEGRYGKIYHDIEEAADHVLSFIENAADRQAFLSRAYQYVFESYTPRAFAEKWHSLMKSLS